MATTIDKNKIGSYCDGIDLTNVVGNEAIKTSSIVFSHDEEDI
jgi:hypothetical protein